MSEQQNTDAVAAALRNDWDLAVKLNNVILKECPTDVDCLNRLGKAYLELGDNKKACLLFKKVLKISRFDPIATKNLQRAQQTPPKKANKNGGVQNGHTSSTPVAFLEEPGKTKIIGLVNVAPANVLLSLNYADKIIITTKRHTVMATDQNGQYLGAFPDDLGHRLLVLTKGGNEYEGFIKGVTKNSITIFVRESVRAKKFHDTPSFAANGNDYLSYVREDTLAVHEPQIGEETAKVSDEEDDGTTDHKMNYSDEETEE